MGNSELQSSGGMSGYFRVGFPRPVLEHVHRYKLKLEFPVNTWHVFSWKFYVISCHKSTAVWSKSTPNSMSIACHLSRFDLLSMREHDMDFEQGQVMEFPWHFLRKWWDFHRSWSHFRTKPNCHQKDMRKWENPCHIFYRV